jgi:hypothetical protein
MKPGKNFFTLGGSTLFIPDLTLWFQRNVERNSLPPAWKGLSLKEICRDLGVPCFNFNRPWRTEYRGTEETAGETGDGGSRFRRWKTSRGTLESRWTRGPDGDWWQTEYPVKTAEDLPAVREIVRSRVYIPLHRGTEDRITEDRTNPAVAELPMRPFSEVLHSFLGWNEGFMIALEAPETVAEITAVLEEKYLRLVEELAGGAEEFFYAPDNLDGRFISSDTFAEALLPGYAKTAEALHRRGKGLIVHAGGILGNLLPGLAKAGVDVVEGVAGPPQGDTTLSEARRIAGPEPVLWGGLPQDYLLSGRTEEEFRAAAREVLRDAKNTPNAVFGVADRVPADALPERMEYLTGLGRPG